MAHINLIDENAMTPEQQAAFDLLPSNLARGLVNTDPRIVAAKFRLAGTYVACDLDPQLQVFTSGAAGPATPGCDNWRGLWPFVIAGQRPQVVAL